MVAMEGIVRIASATAATPFTPMPVPRSESEMIEEVFNASRSG